MHVDELRVTNFKSFSGNHVVLFSPGVNCITGPNGAGKSNLLEALCFALGCSQLHRFRIKQWKDLLHCSEKEASAQLKLTTASQLQVAIAAKLSPAGQRTYYVNQRLKTKKELKRFLRSTCGMNLDVSLCLIQQHLVHKMATKKDDELAAYLCEVRHSYLVASSSSKRRRFKPSLEVIQANIALLEASVVNETACLERQVEMHKLTHAIAAHEATLQHLRAELIQTRIAANARELLAVEEAIRCSEATMHDLKSRATAVDAQLCELASHPPLEATEARLDHWTAKQAEAGYVLAAAVAEEASLQTQHESLALAADIARRELTATSERRDTANMSLAKGLFLRRALTWYAKTIDARPQCAAAFQLETLTARRRDATAHERDAQAVREELARLAVAIGDAEARAAGLRGAMPPAMSAAPDAIVQVQHELREQERAWADLEMRYFPALGAQPARQGRGAEAATRGFSATLVGDHGALLSVFRLEPAHSMWWSALGLVLDGQLCHRVCDDAVTAQAILGAHSRRASLVLWPLADLRVARRAWDAQWPRLQQEFGDCIADPLVLLTPVDERFHPVVAVGSWLLVDSDVTAQSILARYGVPCVTQSLNMHSPAVRLAAGELSREWATQLHAIADRIAVLRAREADLQRGQEAQARAERLREEVTALEVSCDGMRADKRRLEQRLEQLETDRVELVREVKASAYRRLELSIYDDLCRDRIAYCRSTVPVWADEARRVHQCIADAQSDVVALEATHRELDEQAIAAQDRMETLSDDASGIAHALTDARLYRQRCEAELAHGQRKLADVEASLDAAAASAATTEQLMREKQMLDERRSRENSNLCELTAARTKLVAEHPPIPQSYRQATESPRAVQADVAAAEAALRRLQAHASLLVTNGGEALASSASAEGLAQQQRLLSECRTQAAGIVDAIATLEAGIAATSALAAEAQSAALAAVQVRFCDIFNRLVPLKRAALEPTDPSALEIGLRFVVDGLHQATRELSGGQLTLLGLAFVFALAQYSASPVYVLDEIDAALDEPNQRAVADLVWRIFGQSQVFCISHHESVHAKATTLLRVRKDGLSTRVEAMPK
ncbi:hypothetical protein ACHHYP_07261 [Achlya hypogyna]|uniref:RecF/RecN/SMC N-terminal domain-containing protein n=1 Tax=Achlya hypogyna TaxID=1202772 RepID=A0A1V9ZMH3_ACHHY|nr:hypothetical protein ACHHYP_07261 [Achlya hypogyna]